ncbi:MAG TPA: DUF3090 family protein [Actinomycetota bacterium]|nr:DUF3090 family protein [Actinomycetota bacterium]
MDLEQVDRITADAVGEPGSRTFYLQMRSGGEVVSVLLEKQQLQLLASSIEELLGQLERATDTVAGADAGLEEPLEPLWRVGRLSLGYHEDLDLVLLEVEELVPEDEESEEETDVAPEAIPEPEPERQRIRVWATREQMLGLARHGSAVVAAGRPLCQFCGNPLDPAGHTCPAMNGHGSPTP